MSDWNYGDAFQRFPVHKEGFVFDDGSVVKTHDIFNPLPDFMLDADAVFVDPPWNQGNMTSFYTKAEKVNPFLYKNFYKRLFECIKQISPQWCFAEVGKEYLPEFILEMRAIYKHVTFYNSMYYNNPKNLCYVVQGLNTRKNFKLDGMDKEKIIQWICENIDYKCIADLCMGRGLVGYYSYINSKRFVGTELNHKRLSVLVERIETYRREHNEG